MPDTVTQIEEIRTINNVCWMNILRIALKYAPDETKEVLRKINANDRQISDALGRLANE